MAPPPPRPAGWNRYVRGSAGSAGSSLSVPAPPPPTLTDGAHVIFCVDNSGSMRKADASSEDGTAISRADAVAACCRQLVAQQQQEGQGQRQRYSRVLFHTEAKNSFTQVEVDDAASMLVMPLTPTHGTNFSAAWLAVEKLVEATNDGVAVRR